MQRVAATLCWVGLFSFVQVLGSSAIAGEAVSSDAAQAVASPVGRTVDDFTLRDSYGKSYSLAEYADKQPVVIVFLGVDCPLAKIYGPRLARMAEALSAQGVKFLGINANQQDSITEMAAFNRQHGITFPVLKDAGNEIADRMGAQRTPEAFVLDGERVVRYWGRIDDQYGFQTGLGYARPKLNRSDVEEAVRELLAGQPVSLAVTRAPGCLIGRVIEADPNATVTYSQQVSRLLQKHCMECHREGQIAPFPLTTYEEVAGWAPMIEEVVRQQRMPPWHADSRYGHFMNDRSMSDDEKEQIYAWVKSGAPEGDPSQLPPPRQFFTGWQAGEPDVVIHMSDKPHPIQAEGTIPYQYFVVDPGFTEDKWLKATECQIDNHSVVHHMFVFAKHPGTPEIDVEKLNRGPEEAEGSGGADSGLGDPGIELIAGAAPGTPAFQHPEGMAMYVPAGSKLIFQMHYTANGTATEDRSAVGFQFAEPSTIRHRSQMGTAINVGFTIPPRADNHRVESSFTFFKDSLLLNVAPHMHLRGKSFRYELIYPNGEVETILNVPRYDFNWQVIYAFTEPRYIPAGTKMHCVAHFDNSADNLANPDPDSEVRWGDQTWEEMMIGWFEASYDYDTGLLPADKNRTAGFRQDVAKKPLEVAKLLAKLAKKASESEEAFDKFARRVARDVPQLDRVDWSVVEGDAARVSLVYQLAAFKPALGGKDTLLPAGQAALVDAAAGEQATVWNDLSQAPGEDMQSMRRIFRASMHVPVRVGGRMGTLNFWSREKDAFPPEAVKFLEDVARMVGGL